MGKLELCLESIFSSPATSTSYVTLEKVFSYCEMDDDSTKFTGML